MAMYALCFKMNSNRYEIINEEKEHYLPSAFMNTSRCRNGIENTVKLEQFALFLTVLLHRVKAKEVVNIQNVPEHGHPNGLPAPESVNLSAQNDNT